VLWLVETACFIRVQMHRGTRDAILHVLASWKFFLRALSSYELNLYSCKLKPISLQMWEKRYYKTNRKAKTVLCSVIKHARKWREHSSSREKHSPAARVHPTLLSCSHHKAQFWLFYLLINPFTPISSSLITSYEEPSFWHLRHDHLGGGATPYSGLHKEASPKRDAFFKLAVY